MGLTTVQRYCAACDTNTAQTHQLPHYFAGKGVLNVLGRVLQKRYLLFKSYDTVALHMVVNWPVLPFITV